MDNFGCNMVVLIIIETITYEVVTSLSMDINPHLVGNLMKWIACHATSSFELRDGRTRPSSDHVYHGVHFM